MIRHKILASALLASGTLMLAHGDAQAAIRCNGNYQLVDGRPVETGYCREWNLASVARTYGWRITFEAIRNDESKKAQVCRAIGFDNRVEQICAPFLNDGRGGRT
jgi:hypothetical protein